MKYLDIVDVLLDQHETIRQLGAQVQQLRGEEQARCFAELAQLVYRHETGERSLVHPATSDSGAPGSPIGEANSHEGDTIARSFTDLQDRGPRQPDFDRTFVALYRAALAHNAREERDEFPLLRLFVPAQRLHMMASELHDLQVMGAP